MKIRKFVKKPLFWLFPPCLACALQGKNQNTAEINAAITIAASKTPKTNNIKPSASINNPKLVNNACSGYNVRVFRN